MNKDFQDLVSNAQKMFEKQRRVLDKELDFIMNNDNETNENKQLIKSLVEKFDKAIDLKDKNSLNALISEVTNKINQV